MKTLSLFAVVLALGITIGIGDAEAKRLGGGKSTGMQREMTPPAKAPNAAPAPSQAAAAPAAGAAAGAAAKPGRSWMGPIAGLAAGLGLAALASHFGFGEELANMMMMALLAFVVIAAIGFFMRKRAGAQQPALLGAGAGQQGMQYSADRMEPVSDYAAAPTVGAGGMTSAVAGSIPTDFDVDGFVRNAKVNFIRLQAANDAGNLDDIRDFTSPEMFAEIKMDIADRKGLAQETDVITLNGDVLDVAEEANRYVVSIRFTGELREEKGAAPTALDEVWHMSKPRDGSKGWVVAGIQQVQ